MEDVENRQSYTGLMCLVTYRDFDGNAEIRTLVRTSMRVARKVGSSEYNRRSGQYEQFVEKSCQQ